MTDRELATYRAGIRHSADLALITALELELRDDGGKLRQRAAIEALRGLAEGLKAEALPVAEPGNIAHIAHYDLAGGTTA